MRFLLIDRIVLWKPGVRGRAVKCVAFSEDFFDDHFPLRPLMPGSLIIEGMAQLAGVLLEEGMREQRNESVKALLSIVEKAKFRTPVKPGDTLEYEARVESVNDSGGKVSCRALLRGEVAAECSLVFSFHKIDDSYLESRRAETVRMWLDGLNGDAE